MPSIGMVAALEHQDRIRYMETQAGERRIIMEKFEQCRLNRGWFPWSSATKAANKELKQLIKKYPQIYLDFYYARTGERD